MVRKKLAMAILALSTLQADLAGALGLGNLSIKSALNQPLNAEIRLLDTGDLDPSQVKIQLASPEDFQHAGVDRDFFLTNLRFDVELDGRGGGLIRVTTREPVVEPYLNFVLETRWPTGRLLREYAMLLDPPTFSAKAAAPVTPATGAGPAPKPGRRIEPPSVSPEPAPESRAGAPSNDLPAATRSGEYRIQVYDTLSKIAARHKPAGDATLQQTMVAIQRANPQVFIRNNINLIKSGYVLRLPSADEVRAIDAGEAARSVEEQTHNWRGGSSGAGAAPAASGPQLDARTPAPARDSEYREQARLSIAAPGGADKSDAGEGGSSGKGGGEALRNQLTSAQESLEKGQRENKELQSRLDDMERQIATLQRLISLKDDQLAALQAKSAAGGAAPAPSDAPAAQTEPAPAQTAPAPESAAAPAPDHTAAGAPAPAPAPKAKPKPAPKAAAKPAPEPGLLEQISGNPLYAVGGLGALALLGAAVVMRRRRAAAEELEAVAELGGDGDGFHFDENLDLDNVRVSDDALTPLDEPESEAPQPAAAEERRVSAETGNAIAEADIYIAYGRYQQAADLLLTAIDAEPARSDLRVKLLEVYLEMRNRDAFGRQFVALQGLGDAAAIGQVKDLLSSVDGVSDWLSDLPQPGAGGSIAATVASAALAATALPGAAAWAEREPEPSAAEDVPEPELLAADETETVFAAAQAEPEPALDLDVNLDLDTEELEAGTVAAAGGELVFDLDLDADAGDGLQSAAEDLSALSFDLDIADADAGADLDLDGEALALDGEDLTVSSLSLDEADSLDEVKPSPVEEATPSVAEQSVDEGFELDLEQDDLDLALSELEGSADLEDLSIELGDSEGAPRARPERDFAAELDSLAEDFDLGVGTEAVAAEVPQLDDLATLESLDELGDLGGEDFDAAPASAAAAGDDFDFLADADEVATKLDLARAYIDMGDTDGAKDILDEVLQEGSDGQKQEASSLLARIA